MTSSSIRKLRALSYPHNPRDAVVNDEDRVRQLIYWVEDTKIRHLESSRRKELLGENSKEAIESYLKSLKCPYGFGRFPLAVVDWLLSCAIKLEYNTNKDKISDDVTTHDAMECEECAPLDVNTPQFKDGVNILRDYLRIPSHHDYLQVLKACRILIENRLNPNFAVSSSDKMTMGLTELGFDLKDNGLNEGAKVLRLLHIEELRALQTQINECIVSAQAQTANPKTDTSLGKVGRG